MQRRCNDVDDDQRTGARHETAKLSLAEILAIFTEAASWSSPRTDGSSVDLDDAVLGFDLLIPAGLTCLASAPGELGLARACISGDLEPRGVHLGDPYNVLKSVPDSSTSSGRHRSCWPMSSARSASIAWCR